MGSASATLQLRDGEKVRFGRSTDSSEGRGCRRPPRPGQPSSSLRPLSASPSYSSPPSKRCPPAPPGPSSSPTQPLTGILHGNPITTACAHQHNQLQGTREYIPGVGINRRGLEGCVVPAAG
eukprot:5360532-Pyramimonas_sp.AAC.2